MAAKSITITDFRTQIPGKLSDDRTIWEFPTVTSTNAHSKDTYWKIYVKVVHDDVAVPIDDKWFDSSNDLPAGYSAVTKVDSGLVGRPPKKSTPNTTTVGKNLDKANRTNAFTQALRDALGDYNAQLKKAKTPTSVEGTNTTNTNTLNTNNTNTLNTTPTTTDNYTIDGVVLYPPMLSQNSKHKKSIKYTNTYTQIKYNGVRAVLVLGVTNKAIVYSRNRNIYPDYDFVSDELKLMVSTVTNAYPEYKDSTIYFDSEIYTHGKRLQDLAGDTRKSAIDKSSETFYVFDLFIPSKPDVKFSTRLKLLESLSPITGSLPHFRLAPTYPTNTEAEVRALYTKFKSEGYEGAMLRIDAPYEYSYNAYHSDVLLKMKPVEDAEFKITGYTQGTNGKSKGTLMMVCETDNGIQFNVSLKDFTIPEAKAKYLEMSEVGPDGKTVFASQYLGKRLIVYYEELSTLQVPLRAKTKLEVRDWD